MEVLPLLREGKGVGEIQLEREGLYLRFSLRGLLPEGIWCVWLVGEQGELRLGIPEPERGESCLCRRISLRSAAPLGRLLRGEVRSPGQRAEAWTCVPRPAGLFREARLRQALDRCGGAMVRREGARLFLALPYDGEKPFPLEFLFCFACIRSIRGQKYAVFSFDGAEWPVFSLETERNSVKN